MMNQDKLYRIREAIRGESLDGWLFSNFKHRDKLSDEILDLPSESTNSRPWLYVIPIEGEMLRIVSGIEAGMLDSLPGQKIVYTGREEFISALAPLAGRRWGAHFSPMLPVVSYLDFGTATLLTKAGLDLVPAAGLIQRLKGLLSPSGLESHKRAAISLYEIVAETWNFVQEAYRSQKELHEGDVRNAILSGMDRRGIETDHPPIVASGPHAGDPHYDFAGMGSPIKNGDVIQLDLWAKEKQPLSIYADISWLGIYGPEASPEVEKAFTVLISARERALDFLNEEFAAKRIPSGASVDEEVRKILVDAGYSEALRHRTGHGIDTECHGSGANIDSIEFPDDRLLLDGSCFSIEPGIYFPTFGLRTEIDLYIQDGKAKISGGERQFKLLFCDGSQ
ncbi:M24 family metallopeptidase [Treponema sp.]